MAMEQRSTQRVRDDRYDEIKNRMKRMENNATSIIADLAQLRADSSGSAADQTDVDDLQAAFQVRMSSALNLP